MLAGLLRNIHPARFCGALESLIPKRCVFCACDLRASADAVYGPVCRGCATDLPWIGAACKRCGEPLPELAPVSGTCGTCQLHPPPWDFARAPLRYEFPIDAAIKALKFQRRLWYSPVFAAILCAECQALAGDIDALLPVPLHWQRQLTRGFNQAEDFCKPIASLLHLRPLTMIRRIKSTPYQSSSDAGARLRNLRSAFQVSGHITARHVLIVDDVITTGATCGQLASVLRRAGVQTVSVLALARTVRS